MTWAKKHLNLTVKTVSRPQDTSGFVVLPRRWVVERSLARIVRARRHARDYERLIQHSETLITWAAITVTRHLTKGSRCLAQLPITRRALQRELRPMSNISAGSASRRAPGLPHRVRGVVSHAVQGAGLASSRAPGRQRRHQVPSCAVARATFTCTPTGTLNFVQGCPQTERSCGRSRWRPGHQPLKTRWKCR